MPDISRRLTRFLRFRRSRSRSPEPSPPRLRDDTDVLRPSDSSACPGLSSCSFSEPAMEPASDISSPSAVGYRMMDSQNSAGNLVANRAQENFTGGQPPQAPWRMTPAAVGSIAQQSTTIASPSNSTDFVEVPQPLLQPSTYTLTTPSQRSLTSELPRVSFSYEFMITNEEIDITIAISKPGLFATATPERRHV
jgi:hypothetical protein